MTDTTTSDAATLAEPMKPPPMTDVEQHNKFLTVLNQSEKSCLTCVNLVTSAVAPTVIGKAIGVPVCRAFGVPVQINDSANTPEGKKEEIDLTMAKRIAYECPRYEDLGDFMDRQSDGVSETDAKKTLPVVDLDRRPVMVGVSITDDQASAIKELAGQQNNNLAGTGKNCAGCAFFVNDKIMRNSKGWTVGGCGRFGKIIYPRVRATTASSCDEFTPYNFENQMVSLSPFTFRDFYTPEYYHFDAYLSYGRDAEHPLNYPSDAPVTPEDTERGIIAWRAIPDPDEAGRRVLMPIYDPDLLGLTDDEKLLVPQPGDAEHPELYLDHGNNIYKLAVAWWGLDETPMAWGPAGTGKTEAFRHAAFLTQLPFYRFNLTPSTEVDDLIGKMMASGGNTFFQKGRLPLAWERPSIVLLDEPNSAPNDVWMLLRPLTDNSKQMVLDASSGERVIRHNESKLGMAANPSWDPRNTGVQSIGDADASRLLHLSFGLPPDDLEMKIIEQRVALDGWHMAKRDLAMVMKIATDIRALSEDGAIPITWGIRNQIKVARLLRWMSPLNAYRLAVDSLEPEAVTTVLDAVRAHDNSKQPHGGKKPPAAPPYQKKWPV